MFYLHRILAISNSEAQNCSTSTRTCFCIVFTDVLFQARQFQLAALQYVDKEDFVRPHFPPGGIRRGVREEAVQYVHVDQFDIITVVAKQSQTRVTDEIHSLRVF